MIEKAAKRRQALFDRRLCDAPPSATRASQARDHAPRTLRPSLSPRKPAEAIHFPVLARDGALDECVKPYVLAQFSEVRRGAVRDDAFSPACATN